MMTPPNASGVLEAALYAPDLEAAEAFYHGIMGLEVVLRLPGRHVFFRVGTTVLLVFDPTQTVIPSANSDLPVPTHGAIGPGHVCFTASRAEITKWRALFESHAVPIEAEFDWPNGARSLYLRDPAGNSVEFAEPRLWF